MSFLRMDVWANYIKIRISFSEGFQMSHLTFNYTMMVAEYYLPIYSLPHTPFPGGVWANHWIRMSQLPTHTCTRDSSLLSCLFLFDVRFVGRNGSKSWTQGILSIPDKSWKGLWVTPWLPSSLLCPTSLALSYLDVGLFFKSEEHLES